MAPEPAVPLPDPGADEHARHEAPDVTLRLHHPNEWVETDELVARARSDDEDAYMMLFERFHDEVYRYATRRLGDPASGQEVAADTMADAFAGLHRYRAGRGPFEAYLYTIARRRVADRFRHLARTPMAGDVEPDGVTPDPSTGVVEGIALRELVQTLPPTERDVVALRFMEGLDVEATARRLGKKPGAVRVAQHRALRRLRDRMESAS